MDRVPSDHEGSPSTRKYQGSRWITKGLSSITKDHQGSPRIAKDHVGSPDTKDHQGSRRITKDHIGSPWMNKNDQNRSTWIKKDQYGSKKIKIDR